MLKVMPRTWPRPLVLLLTSISMAGCMRSQGEDVSRPSSGGGGNSEQDLNQTTGTSSGQGGDSSTSYSAPYLLRGTTVFSLGERDVVIDERGRVAYFPPDQGPTELDVVELDGHTILPAFIDSHVHLAYYDVRAELPLSGVMGAVDLAAPVETLAQPSPLYLELLSTGPMITAPLGYPTRGWGSNGYGIEVGSVEEARDAALSLLDKGADVLKIPFAGDPLLSSEQVTAAVQVAHDQGKLVATHALGNTLALQARQLGCDFLAHTPTEELSEVTLAAWSDGAVVSTLAAFGASPAAVENLRRLHERGAKVLYGTDLGNLRTQGLSLAELNLLSAAGLSNEEIIESLTTAASDYFDMQVGQVSEGQLANLVVVSGDPLLDISLLTSPRLVIAEGSVIFDSFKQE